MQGKFSSSINQIEYKYNDSQINDIHFNQDNHNNLPFNFGGSIMSPNYPIFINNLSPLNDAQFENIHNDNILINDKVNEDNINNNNINNLEKEKIKKQKNEKDKIKKKNIDKTTFYCEECEKSYLSYPALYTHIKTKHPENKSERKRGRPKKEEKSKNEENIYDPFTIEFFNEESRNGKINKDEFNLIIEEAFNYLYDIKNLMKFKNNEMKIYNNINEHSFFKKFLYDQHDAYKTIINQDELIDIVFINYLNQRSLVCNKEFYKKLICLIVLFRDYINKKNIKNNDDYIYTEENEAEEVPNYSNSFFNNFFFEEENKDFLGLSYDDVVGILINLCYWLYEHNYTSFKLSMKENN